MVTRILKYLSLPVLLVGSVFLRFAASYEFLLNVVVCLSAIIVVQWAVREKEYLWAAGFVAIAVIFSPLVLVLKIFLLLGLTCVASSVALFAAWKKQPMPAA